MTLLIFFILVAAIIFNNKEAIDQGFCHLQQVKIQVLLDCEWKNPYRVTIALGKNESDTSGNYILQCFWIHEEPMVCSKENDTTGAYNECNDILEIEFIFNYTKHLEHYLRITTYCNSSSIALKPCRRCCFIYLIFLFRFGKRTNFTYLKKNYWFILINLKKKNKIGKKKTLIRLIRKHYWTVFVVKYINVVDNFVYF